MTPVLGELGGLPAANISKVEGLPVASIASVMGLAWPSLGYHYGYPAYPNRFEPFVAAQWKFDDGWYNFTGITLSGAYQEFRRLDTATPELDVGASENIIIEFTASKVSTSGLAYLFTLQGNEDASWPHALGIICYANGTSINFVFTSDDGTYVGGGISGAIPTDGQTHIYRFVVDRATSKINVFIDNTLVGFFDASSVAGKGITSRGFRLGGQYNGGGANWDGTIYECTVGIAPGLVGFGDRGPGSGVSPWTYLSDSTPGLVAHWKMQESSGDITDSKSDIVLVANGAPTYSVSGAAANASIYDCTGALGDWSNFSGIGVGGNGPNGYFYNGSGNTAVEPGTGDFTIEWVGDISTADGGPLFRTLGGSGGMQIWWNSDKTVGVYIVYSDSSSDIVYFTDTVAYTDGLPHKWRLSCARDAADGFVLKRDGVIYGAPATGLPSAKTIASSTLWFGFYSYAPWTFREFRFSKNATNNSGGPNETPPPYLYGSDSDPNVTAHWKFDEPSGSIIDTIGSLAVAAGNTPIYSQAGPSSRPPITLTPYDPAFPFTYDVANTGVWVGVSPGITVNGHSCPWYSGLLPALNIAANEHVVIEGNISVPPTPWPNGYNILLSWKVATGGICTVDWMSATSCLIDLYWEPSGENYAFITTTAIDDGNTHKVRLVLDRAGDCVLYLDGVEQGRFAISGSAAKTMTWENLILGGHDSAGAGSPETYYELRISKSTDPAVLLNNSGGPNGG